VTDQPPPDPASERHLTCGDLALDVQTRTVRVSNGQPVSISPSEARFLVEMIRCAGALVTRDRLRDIVGQQPGERVPSSQVTSLAFSLRQRVPYCRRHLANIRGDGYILNLPALSDPSGKWSWM
jgi:DNA-binding response OmpR family regulator